MRRLLVALAVIIPALVACGSGGDGTDAVSIKTLQLAASNTQDAESTRFTIEMTDGPDSVLAHASGVTSGDGENAEIVMELPEGRHAEQRVVDGVLYLDVGDSFFGAKPPDGKRWIELDLRGLSEIFGKDLASAFGGSQTPASALDALERLTGDVERVGDETVAGRPATHYRGSIDRDGVGTSPVDVWIDAQDRVVKLHVGVADTGAELTMEIVEFGVPVEVEPPPPDEVASFEDLLPDGLLPDGLRPREGLTA
jgi:hypothetical protein